MVIRKGDIVATAAPHSATNVSLLTRANEEKATDQLRDGMLADHNEFPTVGRELVAKYDSESYWLPTVRQEAHRRERKQSCSGAGGLTENVGKRGYEFITTMRRPLWMTVMTRWRPLRTTVRFSGSEEHMTDLHGDSATLTRPLCFLYHRRHPPTSPCRRERHTDTCTARAGHSV